MLRVSKKNRVPSSVSITKQAACSELSMCRVAPLFSLLVAGLSLLCCSASVLLSRTEQGCAPNLGLLSFEGGKKGISNLDFLCIAFPGMALLWNPDAVGFWWEAFWCCFFLKNCEITPVIFLPEPGEAEESSYERGSSWKLLSITLRAGGSQCHCCPV